MVILSTFLISDRFISNFEMWGIFVHATRPLKTSSNILVIGDIINEKGLLDINCIRLKLKKKGNYLCESKLIWNCIPKSWKEVLCKDRICYTNLAGQSLFHKISQKSLQLNSNVQGKMTRFIYRFLGR